MTKIFSYAKQYKSKVYFSIVLATLGVFAGMIPYYLVYRIIMAFTGASLPSMKWSLMMPVLILLCLVMRSILYFSALTASHEAAFDTLLGLRQAIAEKMIKMPIGEIQKKKHGEYKSTIVDLIDDMELILAHIIPEGISNALVPILVILYLFVIDYRMAILALINIPIGMFIYSKAMKKAAVKLPQQIHAFQSMNATMVEFINGIKVIKIFNQTTSSFQKYTASVKNYKKFV
ncbi:MAG: ABC transporter ATP-binding protein/permease, partial [Firmicutes bacterium]|nr:ABC transporter ATP-binding protein/permease [Bacillota bacterium]